MSNQEIADLLRNVAASYTIKDEKKFRFQIIAYQRAADSIEGSSIELLDYYKEGKLDAIPGVGASLRSHLEELFKNGKVRHFDWALKGIPQTVFVLMKIPTFGPKKAYRLVKEFNLTNKATVIEDLKQIAKSGKISLLRGFGERSEKDILRAITEFKKGKGKTTRMVLPFAQEISDKVLGYLKKNPYVEKVYALGSLRRMLPTVGDIDIAIASNNPNKVIKYFISYPYLERVIEKGDTTSSILVSGGRQVDLMIQPPEAFGSLLQHFTGSKNHNIALREFAIKKGFSLSEYGIKNLKIKKSKLMQFADEEDFYHAIGLPWMSPEIRENAGEIELAEKNKLPKLVELKDIKGDFHLHSNFPIEPSHDVGNSTLPEMVDKATSLRYSYMGFSEHNPSISKHTKKEILALVKKRNKAIEHILSGNKSIRVFKMLEIDILPTGMLAVDNDVLDLLDFAIVSIHSVFKMGKAEMTKRVLSGLSHKKAKILAHPTGRMLNQRTGYELDWPKIFKFCKENSKALEINSWPTRLDLPDSVIRQAVEAGVKIIINTDSHAVSHMDNMKYGVAMARRGWAKKSDILNTLSYNEFIKWVNL